MVLNRGVLVDGTIRLFSDSAVQRLITNGKIGKGVTTQGVLFVAPIPVFLLTLSYQILDRVLYIQYYEDICYNNGFLK